MKIFHSSKAARGKFKKLVLALGNFDGIHLAHRKMFEWTALLANELKAKAGVYTFDPHPVKVLSPASTPPLIGTPEQKIKWIKKNKIKVLILEPFDKHFAALGPEDFFNKILIETLGVKGLVVGYDFTFGKSRSGNLELLEKLCKASGIKLKVLPAFYHKNTLVSSTQIRHFILNGKILEANLLLGRPFTIQATVVRGKQIGRTLNFPTANLMVANELLPLSGVYATLTKIGLRKHHSVTNIGWRPTFYGNRLTIETHLLKLTKNLYGKKLQLSFIDRIREERKFENPEALVAQIHKDIECSKKIFKRFHL
ncbi:MAG: bifunctional riboflavin kinase/FAD synthetase [Deltaproteobacteria bacterium]|nr:bifunctional riboflavin kinase/FAD synthetase [Deltaproteobacteria bacterium]